MSAEHVEIIKRLDDMKDRLERCSPSGGVGENGATKKELEEAEAAGLPFDGDAAFHEFQTLWHIVNELMDFVLRIGWQGCRAYNRSYG